MRPGIIRDIERTSSINQNQQHKSSILKQVICLIVGCLMVVYIATYEPLVDELVVDRSESIPYPTHWGRPPLIQTKDMRPLPQPFKGHGSSTLINWINARQRADASTEGEVLDN